MQGSRPLVRVVRLGLVSYQEGLRLQQVYVDRHRSGPAHSLLLCEHPPVYTTGIRHQPYPASRLDPLRLLGAEVHRANRGGLITFHGPGQLVCYPVLDLSGFRKSVRWYVAQLEKTVVSACGSLGVTATTSPHTGVWVGDNKICAMGTYAPAPPPSAEPHLTGRGSAGRDPLRPLRHVPRSGSELQHGPVLVLPHRSVRHRGQRRDVAQQGAAARRERARGHAPPAGRLRRAFPL
ncbi:putative lipoyltransferase 2, mitochondrial isoform X1 [Oryzias latipes]|uniref:putative lipoyltransferase 2, mitochondrial isoform X1 n=1 Tax=Oryzias latipes TaxID=8090 RepID=UPI000CE224B0|nr:putative lipoyltransferase 2, mitochondrial isoform X1 [Oryzias latipes]